MSNESSFDIMQIAATLAAGLLSNNPHGVHAMNFNKQAEIASNLYKECVSELSKPWQIVEGKPVSSP